MDIIERDIYALIASGDGIKAREIAKKLNKDRSTVNHYLYNSPYMTWGWVIIADIMEQ